MHRIDLPSAATSLPAPAAYGTPGYFQEGNPLTGVEATIVDEDWANAMQEELVSIVLAAGIALDKANRAQVLAAILALGRFGHIAIYRNLSGTQQVSIDGAAFTTVGATTFAAPVGGVAEYEGWAAGGGSGGSAGAAAIAGAGGGGGYFFGIARGLTTATTITVGAPGVAGSSAGPTSGTAGGTTSFGALASATGGGGGGAMSGAAAGAFGAGGAASGGNLAVAGQSGGLGYTVGGAQFAAPGGAAFKCGQNLTPNGSVAVGGVAGVFPGQGATGSFNGSIGANGSPGLLIVRW